MQRVMLLCVAVLTSALFVACGKEVSAMPTTAPATIAEPTSTAIPSEFARILGLMPDTPESRGFTRINSYLGIASALGLEVPGPDASMDQVAEYKLQLMTRSVPIGLLLSGEELLSGFNRDYFNVIPDAGGTLGFDARDVAIVAVSGEGVITGSKPLLEVVIGRIDSAMANSLVAECTLCPERPEITEYSGHDYFSWGPDFAQNLRASFSPPAFDEFGRGGHLHFGDEAVVRALRTSDIEAVIDIKTGDGSSLSDLEEWVLAANAVADLDVLSTTFTDRTDNSISGWPHFFGLDMAPISNLAPELVEKLGNFQETAGIISASAPELPPFELAATGTGLEDGKVFAALAVVFSDVATAERASTALQARVADGLTVDGNLETMRRSEKIDSAHISTNGRVVSVKIVPLVEPGGKQLVALRPFLMFPPFATDVPFVQFLLR